MHITIAICTWNRCELLRSTLEQMTRMAHPAGTHWDILVVDNNCTDATQDVVRSFASRLPIRAVQEPTPGKAHAINRALSEVDDLILFTDDDVLVAQDWLTSFAVAADRFPNAAIFGGPIDPWFPVPPDPDLLEAFPLFKIGFCGLDFKIPLGPLPADAELYGANLGFRKTLLQGEQFNVHLGPRPGDAGRVGEESEFVARLRARGIAALWVPEMRVKHYVDPSRMTLQYLRKFTDGGGRTWIRWNGVPPGAQFLGAPLWLARKSAEAWIRSKALALAGRRQASLQHLREHCYFRGMVHECRAIAREKRAGAFADSRSAGA